MCEDNKISDIDADVKCLEMRKLEKQGVKERDEGAAVDDSFL